ncbi:ImmA/IrrE family metallo-endopeptidase [Streptomyces sp. NPDC060205]|uniref:ImmA/IrrE family metallo-endopeptidase n=1 Tax=Streptomyces sp. NPDC060205 TaxID=3347072 RepID=UPI003645F7C1
MPLSPEQLRRELRQAGIANAAIDAAWPQWWSDEAAESVSATAELTFTVARRLGLSPRALFDGSPQFLWRDETKFKNLSSQSDEEEAALASFGMAIGRSAITATSGEVLPSNLTAATLREAILQQSRYVGPVDLLSFCWSFGIPILQLQVFPLQAKRMHAMTVQVDGRFAVLLGLETKYPAKAAYIIAHEIGHIVLGHLGANGALLEMADPMSIDESDDEELAADRFALELLTGREDPQILPDVTSYNSSQLAKAAVDASDRERVDPGVIALCLGHATKKWDKSFGALKIIPPGERDVGREINETAANQFDWGSLSYSSQEYLSRVMGCEDAA